MSVKALKNNPPPVMPAMKNDQFAPNVFWISEPVLPGQVVMALGCDLEKTMAVVLTSAQGKTFHIKPLQVSYDSVKFSLPKSPKLMPGAFTFQLQAGEALGAPLACNAPRVDWIFGDGGSFAVPGGTLRAFGRCLSWTGAGKHCQAYLLGRGKKVALKITQATLYTLTCDLPKKLTVGSYEFVVEDRNGKRPAASSPVALEVRAAEKWPQTIFNVRDYGAKGDAQADDTAAVKSAISAAGKAGGGVVFFPRGRYSLSEGLALPPYVSLKGERKDACLLAWPDDKIIIGAAIRGTHHFKVEDLTLFFSAYRCGIQNMELWFGNPRDFADVTLRNLTIRGHRFLNYRSVNAINEQLTKIGEGAGKHGDTGAMLCLGGDNLTVEDCDMVSSSMGLWLNQGNGVRITNNRFLHGLLGFYWIHDTQRLVFEGNTVQGTLLGNGGGISAGGWAPSKNMYIAHNTYLDIFGADSEAITTDCGHMYYSGRIKSSTADRILLPEGAGYVKIKVAPHNADELPVSELPIPGSQCLITRGRGAGQFRTVKQSDPQGVTLDKPWVVIPDESSEINVMSAAENFLVIGNRMKDARIAFQGFGAVLDAIIAENTCERAGGFRVLTLHYPAYGIEPSMCNQLLNNTILAGSFFDHSNNITCRRFESHVGGQTHQGVPMRGLVIRGNRLNENAFVEVNGEITSVLVEQNSVAHAEVGVLIKGNVRDDLVVANRFSDVKEPVRDERTMPSVHPDQRRSQEKNNEWIV